MPGLPPSRFDARRSTVFALLLAGGLLANVSAVRAADLAAPPEDPFQGANRASYRVSMGLDRALIGPIAHGYMHVTPLVIRDRVSSVVYNLGEPSTALNDIVQVRPRRALRAGSRFVVNSTLGLAGLFDVAARMGIASHDADFGQTLARYGLRTGPYVYVPVFGPSDIRDGLGRIVDFVTDPVSLAVGGNYKTTFNATRLGVTILDTRVRADPAFKALDDATDPYVTARSAYLQHRAAFVGESTGEIQALPDFDTPTKP